METVNLEERPPTEGPGLALRPIVPARNLGKSGSNSPSVPQPGELYAPVSGNLTRFSGPESGRRCRADRNRGPGGTPTTISPRRSNTPTVHSRAKPHARVEGRTFEHSFPLPSRKSKNNQGQKQQRKSNADGKPVKKTAPKTRVEPTPAEVEARAENRRKYDQKRRQTLERKELHRRVAQARRDEAKSLGLCKDCANVAIPDLTRCETCNAKHQASRSRRTAKENAAARHSGQSTMF